MTETAVILTLGKRQRNLELLASMLRETEHDVRIVASLSEFDSLIADRDDIVLAILDVSGFTEDIWERCERLQTRSIPALVLASKIDPQMREQALSHGINSILEKPVRKADLKATVRGLITYATETD